MHIGYICTFDYVRIVILLCRKSDAKTLVLTCNSNFHQELDEVSDAFDEVVITFVGGDIAQEDYVFGEIDHSIYFVTAKELQPRP